MRTVIKYVVRMALAGLSLVSAARLADYSGEVQWWTEALASHPFLASTVRGPVFPILLTLSCLLAVYGEKYLRRPDLRARFVNSRIIPDLSTLSVGTVFNTEKKALGWEDAPVDWWWFVEIQLANDSDTPTTIDDIEAIVKVNRTRVPSKLYSGIGKFKIDMGYDENGNLNTFEHPRYRDVADLRVVLSGQELTHGIGHRGWLRMRLPRVSQKDRSSGKMKLDIILVDALRGRHKVTYTPRSETKWDKSFAIFEERPV